MTNNITMSHNEIFLLLPWYVNGTLSEDEYDKVYDHIDECTTCSEEVRFLIQVNDVVTQPEAVCAIPKNGFSRLMQDLDRSEHVEKQNAIESSGQLFDSKNHPGKMFRYLAEHFSRWITMRNVAVAIPAIILLVVTGVFFAPTTNLYESNYRTLTSDNLSDTIRYKITLTDSAKRNLLQDYIRENLGITIPIEKSQDNDYQFDLPLKVDHVKMAQLLQTLNDSEYIISVEPVTE